MADILHSKHFLKLIVIAPVQTSSTTHCVEVRLYKVMHVSPLVFLLAGHLAVVCLRQLPGYLLGNGIFTLLGNSGGQREKRHKH